MADVNNSLDPNLAKEIREKVSPVVSRDRVVSTKKPLGKRICNALALDDTGDIKDWLIQDVVVPGLKNTALDLLSMLFFGESRGGRRESGSRRYRDDRTDYRSRYRGSSSDDRRYRRSRDEYESDEKVDFRNIILRNRDDAEIVVGKMRERIRNDGSASIACLLDLIDVPGRYTDNNYGWDDPRDIGIRRVSSGYLIDVAEPKYLD